MFEFVLVLCLQAAPCETRRERSPSMQTCQARIAQIAEWFHTHQGAMPGASFNASCRPFEDGVQIRFDNTMERQDRQRGA